MPWQPPHAEMHFILFFLQEYLLVVQSPEQLSKNHSKFAGTMSSKVIMGSNSPALVTYDPYNLGSLDIIFRGTLMQI